MTDVIGGEDRLRDVHPNFSPHPSEAVLFVIAAASYLWLLNLNPTLIVIKNLVPPLHWPHFKCLRAIVEGPSGL